MLSRHEKQFPKTYYYHHDYCFNISIYSVYYYTIIYMYWYIYIYTIIIAIFDYY